MVIIMEREQIILSNFDLEILSFLKNEQFIKDIANEFYVNYLGIKRHMDRLKRLKCYDEKRFGTFKKVIINKKGERILSAIEWKT